MANIVIFNFFFLAILLASLQPVAGMKRQRDDDGGPADPNDHHQQSVKRGSSSVPEIPAQQEEGPRIVYIEKPKKITVDAADFKPIVQRLTVNSEHQQEANVNNNEQGMLSSHGRPLTLSGASHHPLPPPQSISQPQQFAPFIPPPSPTNINSVDRGKSIVSIPSIHHNQPTSSLFSQLQQQQRLLLHTTNSAMFSSADQQPFNQHVMQQQQQQKQIGNQQIHQHHLQQQNRQQQQQIAPFIPSPSPPSTNINSSVDRGKSIVSVPPNHHKQPEFSLFSQYLQQQHSSPDKQLFNQQVMQQQHFSGGEQQLAQHHHPYQLQPNPIHRPTRAGQQQQQQPFQRLHNPRSASTLPTRNTSLSLQQSAVADRSQQQLSSLQASEAAGPEPLPLAQRILHIEPSHHLMFLLPNFKEDGSGSSAVEDKFIELTNRSGQQSLMLKLSSTNNRIFHFSISHPIFPDQYRSSSSVGLLQPGQSCFVRVRLVLPTQNAANFAVHLYENMNNLEKNSHHRISIYHHAIENNNNDDDDIALSALEQWKGIDDERVSKWELAVLYEKKNNNNNNVA